MKIFKILRVSREQFKILIQRALMPLLMVHFTGAFTEQYIFKGSSGGDEGRITFGLIGVVLSLFVALLSFLVISYAYSPKENSVTSYIAKKFKDLFVETLRGLGFVMVGIIFFWTLPRRIFQYFFIGYVVVFHPLYPIGQIDVLEETKRLVKGHLLLVFTVTVLTQLVVWGIDITALKYNIFTTPEIWILIFILEVGITVYIFNIYLNLYNYLKATKEMKEWR